ncbi:MAG: M20/M25/M40 family metallo-hydrolase [Patescibacteria group bacterium]|nr:M20/M25/M40 family metallo-hydrolase [Patescibacteria group bacterium]
MINTTTKKDITEILRSLVAFQTTAKNPEVIQQEFTYITSFFDDPVFETKMFEKDGKYSLLVSVKGYDALRPSILLNGHVDVVPADTEDQYTLKIMGTKAIGRGTVDMKGMVAVLILVMQELGRKENPPNVALLLNADEEVGGKDGAGYLVREIGLRPEFVLCADGPSEDILRLTTKEKGGVWIELTAQGRGAHAAFPWKGENAIDIIIGAVKKIKEFVGEMEPEVWKSTVNIGLIETSNFTPNKVPADARAVLDVRFTEDLASTPDELFEALQNLVPEVSVQVLDKVSMLFVDESNPFVQRFKQVAEEVSGRDVPLDFAHGATDARYFGEIGVPSLIFGAVGGNMHAAAEWVDLESLDMHKEILLRFLSNPQQSS